MPKPTLRLLTRSNELVVSIDSRSWHVLDEPDLFPEGMLLRKAFGVTWVSGLFKEPPYGILQCINAVDFKNACETVWTSLLRDRDLLSYSYQYEFEREKGVRHGGGMGGGFHVRRLVGAISARPTGYCTLKLRSLPSVGVLTSSVRQIIDMRKEKRIETDDAGYLKIHRRSMNVAWYEEMPRILEFSERAGQDKIEVRLFE